MAVRHIFRRELHGSLRHPDCLFQVLRLLAYSALTHNVADESVKARFPVVGFRTAGIQSQSTIAVGLQPVIPLLVLALHGRNRLFKIASLLKAADLYPRHIEDG